MFISKQANKHSHTVKCQNWKTDFSHTFSNRFKLFHTLDLKRYQQMLKWLIFTEMKKVEIMNKVKTKQDKMEINPFIDRLSHLLLFFKKSTYFSYSN